MVKVFQNIIAAAKVHLFGIKKTTISEEIEVAEEDLISVMNIDLMPITVQDEAKKESLSALVRALYYVIEIQEEYEYLEYRNNWDRNNAAVSILLSWLWNSSRGMKDVEISLLNSWGKEEVYKLKAFFTDTESIEIAKEYIKDSSGNDEGYTFEVTYIEDPSIAQLSTPYCDTGYEISDWFTVKDNCIDSNCDTYGTIYNTKAESLYLMYAEDTQKLVAVKVRYWCL